MTASDYSEAVPPPDKTQGPPPSQNESAVPLLVLAAVGLFLSLLLAVIHARTHLLPTADSFCAVGKTFDCTVVATSPASVFFGIPWALWGALGFTALLAAALKRSVWLLPLTVVASVASLSLLALSVFKIGSLCYLCEAVHLTSFALTFLTFKKRSLLAGSWSNLNDVTSIFAFPVGAALALWLFLPPYWGAFSYKSEPPFATGITDEGRPWIGAEEAPVIIEEFVDYRCPHCKIASARTLRKLGRNSEWRVVRHQHPRMACPSGNDAACRAARLAYCAGKQEKFWRADRWLFEVPDPRKEIDIERMISDLDLDGMPFKACFSSEEAFAWADAEYKSAFKQGIIEVPAYVVDGKKLLPNELEVHLKSRGE